MTISLIYIAKSIFYDEERANPSIPYSAALWILLHGNPLVQNLVIE